MTALAPFTGPDAGAALRCARLGPIAADPYPWPYDGTVDARRVALVCMQGGVFGAVATSDAVLEGSTWSDR